MRAARYKRIVLKVSGEALQGEAGYGVDQATLGRISAQVQEVVEMGVQMGIVVGGGNIWRGAAAEAQGMDRATADYAGMLATIINTLALQAALEKRGVVTRAQSALEIRAVAEPYIRRVAISHLERGRVVIFAAGTGNPYMTTDTAAALRAVEIQAEVLLMAKNRVDGVYDDDPVRNPAAKKFHRLTLMEALSRRLEVMDSTALSLCMENNLPIIVFDLAEPNSLVRLVVGEPLGTILTNG